MRETYKMCNCLTLLNQRLAKEQINTKITSHSVVNFETGHIRTTVGIDTEKRDPRNKEKKRIILPTFCPFCGKRYVMKRNRSLESKKGVNNGNRIRKT